MDEKTNISYNLIKKFFLSFINNKVYMFSILIMAILSYGFYLINMSIGIDDLSISNYVKENYSLASGRYTFVMIGWILGYFSFTPFWIEFFCLIVLIISLILINVLLKISSNDKLPMHSYTIFSIVFLSYSIIAESFLYQVNAIFLAFGYLFTILSILLTCKYIQDKRINSLLLSVISLVLAFGLYETFLSVYFLLIIIVAILKLYYSDLNSRKYIKDIIIIVFFAVLLKVLLQFYLNYSNTPNFSNQHIFWLIYDFKKALGILLVSFYENVICSITSNLSFSIFVISFLIYIIIFIKLKKKIFGVLFTFLLASTFIIQIIMGTFMFNRTMNSLSIYVSFAFCLLYAITKNSKMRKIIFVFVVYLCLLSSKNINNELYKDLKRYNYEKYIINQTAFVINNKFGYTEKPVVFLGTIKEQFTNDYNSEIGDSSIKWSLNAFKKAMTETQKLFIEQGHKFNLPTEEQIKEANELFKEMPRFPEEGSVKLINDEFIIVRY